MIDRAWGVLHAGVGGQAHHLGTGWVDRDDAAGVAGLLQQTLGAGVVLGLVGGGADQGDAAGLEQRLRQGADGGGIVEEVVHQLNAP